MLRTNQPILSPIQRFWSLLRQYKIELRQIYGYAVFNGLVNLTLPLGIQAIINYIQAGELTSSWVVLVCIVLFGIGFSGLLQVLQLRIVENMQQDLFAKSAFEFSFRIPKITFIQYEKIYAPELVNRFFDTINIQKGLPKILIDFSLAIFQIVFGLLLLAFYSPFFISLAIALVFIIYVIFRITGPRGLDTSLTESKYKYELAHWLEEIARLNRTFKLNYNQNFHLEKTDTIVENYLRSRESHFQVLINQFKFFIAFKVILAFGLLVLGGFLVFEEQMNIGQFVAAEIIIILIINSVEKVLRMIDTIYDVLTGLEKIGYVTDLKLDEELGKTDLVNPGGISIRAEKISFGFNGNKKKVIDGLSFEVQPGEKVLVSGKSGTGKTLLLQLLAGIHHVDEGEIYLDALPYASIRKSSISSNVSISFPINQIFDGTIRENISLGRDLPDSRLTEILEVLYLKDYVFKQPLGLETPVDSQGKKLPRSVIQKLLIARTIVDSPRLLLMEDPLQFVEEDEKKKIIDYLMSPERNWTVLVISDFLYWNTRCTSTINLI